jgi:hypothetical protein
VEGQQAAISPGFVEKQHYRTAHLLPCLYSSPEDLAWPNARQLFVDGDVPGSVADLKTTDGKDIVLCGGARLAQDLARSV